MSTFGVRAYEHFLCVLLRVQVDDKLANVVLAVLACATVVLYATVVIVVARVVRYLVHRKDFGRNCTVLSYINRLHGTPLSNILLHHS